MKPIYEKIAIGAAVISAGIGIWKLHSNAVANTVNGAANSASSQDEQNALLEALMSSPLTAGGDNSGVATSTEGSTGDAALGELIGAIFGGNGSGSSSTAGTGAGNTGTTSTSSGGTTSTVATGSGANAGQGGSLPPRPVGPEPVHHPIVPIVFPATGSTGS